MSPIDLLIFIIYLTLMLGVGAYFLIKNKSTEDYYVGGRTMSKWHIGLSVVATDVGGGFTIGLGGLGFAIGISGSWMLFTGLVGAWLTAVVLVPKVYKLGKEKRFLTFPQFFRHFYSKETAVIAAIISAIGYLGLTSSQILAGAKLASGSFEDLDFNLALIIMGSVAVLYTFMGGLKAVIYTDTIQWIILMGGLVFIGLPIAYFKIGGYEDISRILPQEFISLSNLKWQEALKWMVTIIPLWFVGMTLYQRIYASKDQKAAQKAWYIAGLFEYPVMAFMGVLLGLFARVAAEQGMFAYAGFETSAGMDSEMGLPLLLRNILPVGLMGLMMAAYFSAVLSTADSCLMAASANLQTDIFGKWLMKKPKASLRYSQVITLLTGVAALTIASTTKNVLNLMLYSYAFMASGLFIPVLGALFTKKPSAVAALVAMLSGGATTILLSELRINLPYDIDANVFGIAISAFSFLIINYMNPNKLLKNEYKRI